MKLPMTWAVTPEFGPRPAGNANECFYCHRPVGDVHTDECVMRQRRIVVRLTMEYPVVVPENWTPQDFEYHRNDGSWCGGNLVGELIRLQEVAERKQTCFCPLVHYTYLREATPDDLPVPPAD